MWWGKQYFNREEPLSTIRPGIPIPKNTDPFFSQERFNRVGIRNVVLDGVLSLVVIDSSGTRTYEDSVFYEAKAVIPIGLSHGTFHTPPTPLVKGGAIKEYVSNSN